VGRNPRGLALSADGTRLFVLNALDETVSVVDIDYPEAQAETMPRFSHRVSVRLSAATPLPGDIALGRRLFNSAGAPMSTGWLSCATCHFDGGHDARTWLGFPDGPRNTPSLLGIANTAPFHWSGDLDELQDVEHTIRRIQGGAGLISGDPHGTLAAPNAGRSPELDALAAYIRALERPPSPFPVDAAAVGRGARAFERWGCAACHTGQDLTDRRPHELPRDGVGQADLQRNPRGLAFDTPSLAGAWATAPYFHDGSAATLRETVLRAGFHGMGWAMDRTELEDLLAYLMSLP
jgi:cytochrome c peroxidase